MHKMTNSREVFVFTLVFTSRLGQETQYLASKLTDKLCTRGTELALEMEVTS